MGVGGGGGWEDLDIQHVKPPVYTLRINLTKYQT